MTTLESNQDPKHNAWKIIIILTAIMAVSVIAKSTLVFVLGAFCYLAFEFDDRVN
jgi:hypothetical protein